MAPHGSEAAMHARDRASGQEAVSEIVGALLLVLVVSSAAFGFGLFLHQQAKETQAQQAAELAVKLEKVTIQGVVPDAAADPCDTVAAPAGTWTTLSFTLTSRHLHDTTVAQLMLNKLALKQASVAPLGSTTFTAVDFSLGPGLLLHAGQSVVVRLEHASCSDADAPFFNPPSGGIPVASPLDLEFATALGNHVETVFTPPMAAASIEPTPGVPTSYVLVGTASQAGGPDAFIAAWTWQVWHGTNAGATCGAPSTDVTDATPYGHRHQVNALVTGDYYCARLTVKDNDGLSSSTEVTFQA